MKPLRRVSSLPISESRWLAYATAGVASAFGLSSSAEAEIHYSGNVSIQLTGNAQVSLPLSNGASLVFQNIFGGSTFLQDFYLLIRGVIFGSGRESFRHWLSNLPRRENVSGGNFYSVAGNPDHGVIFTFWSDGQFEPYYGTRGFIGFRFDTGKGPQYGWARIGTRSDSNNRAHEVIKDYAWADVGEDIRTGQTSSSGDMVNTVTDSGSVGLLALGAAGLVAWRKRRKQAIE
jgi:MYXO-CTERM domain-containing protein